MPNKKTVNGVGEIKLLPDGNDSGSSNDTSEEMTTRELNMLKRKEDILTCAAQIIVDKGVDALKLATVAKMANVTVPTIHNLYGKKQDIYNTLVEQVTNWMFEHVEENSSDRLLDQMVEGVDRLVSRLKKDELFFKAGYLVGERAGYFSRNGQPYKQASKVSIGKYEALIENGDLLGSINTSCLAKFVNDSYRILRADWMRGHLSLGEFKYQLLWSLYASLMSDASPAFKGELQKRIARLEAIADYSK